MLGVEDRNEAREGGQCWEWSQRTRLGKEGNELGNEHRGNGQHWEWSLGMRLEEKGNAGSGSWK